jgi:hypothetical protein
LTVFGTAHALQAATSKGLSFLWIRSAAEAPFEKLQSRSAMGSL